MESSLPSNKLPIKADLENLYLSQKLSVANIAKKYNCSQNKINHWLKKYHIPKRTISDAIYQLKNPLGDPFKIRKPSGSHEQVLFGIGLGLYWGEGQKRGQGGVKLSNCDPRLVKKFIEFLEVFCSVSRDKLRFVIQISADLSPEKETNYWKDQLGVFKNQFYKTQILKSRGDGTYRFKSEHGTIIVYFNNNRLKKAICEMIENVQ